LEPEGGITTRKKGGKVLKRPKRGQGTKERGRDKNFKETHSRRAQWEGRNDGANKDRRETSNHFKRKQGFG